MELEKLEDELARQAIQKGWATNRAQYAARILKILNKDVSDIDTKNAIRKTIRFLEAYEFGDEIL